MEVSPDGWWTAKSVKKYFDLPNSTFYDLIKKGVIPEAEFPLGAGLPRYNKEKVLEGMSKRLEEVA